MNNNRWFTLQDFKINAEHRNNCVIVRVYPPKSITWEKDNTITVIEGDNMPKKDCISGVVWREWPNTFKCNRDFYLKEPHRRSEAIFSSDERSCIAHLAALWIDEFNKLVKERHA